MASGRAYHSPARARQAEATRRRIVQSARRLFIARGFDETTIEAIARAAGVSPPTVYAVFGSKRSILAEMMDRATFGPGYEVLVEKARDESDAAARLRWAAALARHVHDAFRAELDLWRGAAVLGGELADLERAREERRYELQAPLIEYLVSKRRLRTELDVDEARAILWSLTGQELYRTLVVARGWLPDRYEAWLGETLAITLLKSPRRG